MHSMVDDGFWANMGPGNCPSNKSVPAFLAPEKVLSKDTTAKQLAREFVTEHERLVVESFKKCGYSKDWVVGNCHRVEVFTHRMRDNDRLRSIYKVDGTPLFSITDEVKCDFENFKMYAEHTVEFYNQED